MSIQLYNYINSISKNIKSIKIQGKNKNIFRIKDGYFSFTIDLLKDKKCIMCKNKINNCSLKKCKHLYAILLNSLKVPLDDISFLFLNNNLEKVVNRDEIIIKEEDFECPVCLENTSNDQYNKLFQCLNCSKFYHSKCIRKCNTNKCLMCKSEF